MTLRTDDNLNMVSMDNGKTWMMLPEESYTERVTNKELLDLGYSSLQRARNDWNTAWNIFAKDLHQAEKAITSVFSNAIDSFWDAYYKDLLTRERKKRGRQKALKHSRRNNPSSKVMKHGRQQAVHKRRQ